MAQKTYSVYNLPFKNDAAVSDKIAAHIAALTGGQVAEVEAINVINESMGDGVAPTVQLVMSTYVPADDTVALTGSLTNLDTGSAKLTFIAPFAGKVTKVYASPSADPGANSLLSLQINGGTAATIKTNVANGTLAGVVVSSIPLNNNACAAGDLISITNDNGATNNVDALVTVILTKNQ